MVNINIHRLCVKRKKWYPYRRNRINLLFIILIAAIIPAGCNRHTPAWKQMDIAESFMETHPDSALAIIESIPASNIKGKEVAARYALLKSMALDKNYIDTTTFDVLQPAIDYYPQKGTPDEQLKTYYYQGRIYQNMSDKDKALDAFVKAAGVIPACHDSLPIARLLMAQALTFSDFYDFESYTNNYLKAAAIYEALSFKDREFDCLLGALNGTLLLANKTRADSVMNLLNNFSPLDENQNILLQERKLPYMVEFGTKQELRKLVEEHQEQISGISMNAILNIALAYNELENHRKAKQLLDYVADSGMEYDTLKHQAISVSVFESMGHYQEALSIYRDFSRGSDSIDYARFEQKAQSINAKYQIELQAQKDTEIKTRIIEGCIAGIIILVMGIFILLLLVRSNKAKKDLACQREKTKSIENARLKSEHEKLTLENRNLQLERDKNVLEAENLMHRVETLEDESESLKNMPEAQNELPEEVRAAMQVRIEMLNMLLASYITSDERYETPYDAWVKELTADTDAFMNTNRLAFQASHPHFIQYFEEHGLTTDEINYVCLYAIGLRGKEVGNYIKKRSHVNISSAIRKKMGIDKHETNIGIYVRKLLKRQ